MLKVESKPLQDFWGGVQKNRRYSLYQSKLKRCDTAIYQHFIVVKPLNPCFYKGESVGSAQQAQPSILPCFVLFVNSKFEKNCYVTIYFIYVYGGKTMRNNEFIDFEKFESVAEEIREIIEAERDTMDKLPADEELYILRLESILKEFDRVKEKGVRVSHLNVDTTEYYTFIEFLASRENDEEVKETKIKSGLSGEVKAIIEKYEREAKEKNKSFINFASENRILYVLKWIEKESKILPVFLPVFDLKENRKVTESDLKNNSRYVPTADVVRMQEIIEKSNEIMEAREKGEE